MAWLERFGFALLITVSTLSASGFAQEVPTLSISPGKATMVQGETRTFRAVGKDGRMRHNVRWSVSPEHAAKLTTSGDEAVVQAEAESTSLTLTAYAEGDSAQATVEIGSRPTLPAGTLLWTVAPLPGCKSKKLSQAVPSATGPDLYDEEECPQGAFVRALTADGRELWRRQITGAGGVLDRKPVTQAPADTGQHLSLASHFSMRRSFIRHDQGRGVEGREWASPECGKETVAEQQLGFRGRRLPLHDFI